MTSKAKIGLLAITLCFALSSCDIYKDLFTNKDKDTEPPYKTTIAWDSGLFNNYFRGTIVDGNSVFFYERHPEYNTNGIYALTRLNADTGALIWRSSTLFSSIVFCQPVVIGESIYVLQRTNRIIVFDKETGECTARVRVDIDYKNYEFHDFAVAYQNYIYMGLWFGGKYFVRMDVNLIDHNRSAEEQVIEPEVLWRPETGGYPYAKPVVHNNVIYTGTNIRIQGYEDQPVELAGFDIDSKEMVFHTTFGGPEDMGKNIWVIEQGNGYNTLYIYDDVLYYLHESIMAWELSTGKRLYRHVFTRDMPNEMIYTANAIRGAEFYKGKFYYTNGGSDSPMGFRNIHCIDANTGKLVWNDIAKGSESLGTNPVAAYDRLYVTQHSGLRVYEAETGKLIGVDKSFCGSGMGRNILYNDYMICVRVNRDNGLGKLVAVYVGE